MNCPKCKAKLLPVDGEMFCLQCGTAVMPKAGVEVSGPQLEDTTDPILQKAITDSVRHPVHFRLPVDRAQPKPVTTAFVSMRSMLASPTLVPAGQGMAPKPAPVVQSPAAKMTDEPRQAVQSAAHGPGLWRRAVEGWRSLPRAWVAGLVVFGVFLLVNGAIYAALANRVFPGVRVGQADLGGLPLSQVHERIQTLAKPVPLTVNIGGSSYHVNTDSASADDALRVEDQVRQLGHDTPMPLAGLIQTLISKPLMLHAPMSDDAAQQAAAALAAQVDFAASPARVMVVHGKVLLLSDKTGQSIDVKKAAAVLSATYGRSAGVNLEVQKLVPLVKSADYASDVDKAQALLAVPLKLTVKGTAYVPTLDQVGSWLVFAGPGKGVTVDGAQVSAYVASVPGKFDRIAATNALMAALAAGQGLDYTAVTSKVTAAPKLASAASAGALASYEYCVRSQGGSDLTRTLADKAAATLADLSGWSLGGRVQMIKTDKSCNFSIEILPASDMATMNGACAHQTTCLVANRIAVSDTAWAGIPDGWKGTLDAYRSELINHEVGHWLGFQHSSCLAGSSSAVPILATPDVTVPGCSPNWYAIPLEQQNTKVLAGF